MTGPRAPESLGPAGLRLWRSVIPALKLREDELVLFREACRITDSLEALQKDVDRNGVMVFSVKNGQDVANPALVEARQQRQVLSKVLASLRFPDDEDQRPQRRSGGRGAYGRGAS